MMANLASKSLPVLTKGIKLLNSYIQKIDINKVGDWIANKLSAAFNMLSQYMPRVIAAIQNVGKGISDIFSKIKPGFSWLVTEALPAGIDPVKRFAGFIKDNWSTIIPIVAGIATVVVGLAIKLRLIPKIISTYQNISSTVSTIGKALTSPFGTTMLVIGALVAAGIWLYKNWDWISKGIVNVWQNYVVPFFSGIGWFSNVWNGAVNGFKSAWNGIVSWFTGLWEGIVGIFKGYINNLYKNI